LKNPINIEKGAFATSRAATYVQVHGDHMVHTGDGEQVGEHPGGDGTTMALLLGLTGVWEVSRQGSASNVHL
jgi:hypothetical protein